MLRTVALCFALAGLAAGLPNTARAEDWSEEIDRAGFTVGLSAAIGVMLSAKDLERAGMSIGTDVGGGLHAKVGYRLPKWLGGDLHVEWLDQRTSVRGGKRSPNPEDDTVAFTADLKLLLPPWSNGQFYLSAGPGLLSVDGTSEFAARYGAGFDLYFTRNIGMNVGASYVMSTSSLEDFDYMSGDLGFFYRF